MLNALVHRQNRDITAAAESPGIDDLLKIPQNRRRTIRAHEHSIHKIRPGEMQYIFAEALGLVGQQTVRFGTKQVG